MKKIVIAFIICITLGVGGALAHHPAEDMVDVEIYDNIEEMVADTPHASMDFEDEATLITADSVSEAENLIDDGLLANLSLLSEDVTVTITFESEDPEEANLSVDDSGKKNRWIERDDWGRGVIFTIDAVLCSDPPSEKEE